MLLPTFYYGYGLQEAWCHKHNHAPLTKDLCEEKWSSMPGWFRAFRNGLNEDMLLLSSKGVNECSQLGQTMLSLSPVIRGNSLGGSRHSMGNGGRLEAKPFVHVWLNPLPDQETQRQAEGRREGNISANSLAWASSPSLASLSSFSANTAMPLTSSDILSPFSSVVPTTANNIGTSVSGWACPSSSISLASSNNIPSTLAGWTSTTSLVSNGSKGSSSAAGPSRLTGFVRQGKGGIDKMDWTHTFVRAAH
ncbi:hypothetical protein B0H10DRAFT_1949569 [Mycena sp. CBHHK59/15]|nr:hypothetical protein B0H10DRAFT_1949569 [Mycena sp. CBHHK59/15]